MAAADTPERARSLKKPLLVAAALLLAAALTFWLLRPQRPAPVGKVTIAVPTQINSAPMIVASAQGLFLDEGVEVATQPFLLGKDALQSLLDGKADLAVVADVPYVFALLKGNDIGVLAGISQARRALAVVGRGDRGINQLKDLSGKSVGLAFGTNLTYFLDAMLHVNAIPGATVTQVDYKGSGAVAAFKEGKLDAAVVFQPFLAKLEREMGPKMTVFYGEEVYAFRFLLVGKPAWIDAHPQQVQRVLKALMAANKVIHDQPELARRQVGAVVKEDDATMARLFSPDDYVLALDRAMLTALDDETRWAMQRGLVPAGPVPNYLLHMKPRDLAAVKPGAVKIAH